jgi:cellulose synthase/poly-beta-1,6-N-acetylglucosamine synthase-like glycosyltransferase
MINLFCAVLFLIVWTYILYPLFLQGLIYIGVKRKTNFKENFEYPSVTLVIVAHNEQKVLSKTLENVLKLNYPKNKLNIIVSSDHSTDSTNDIVKSYFNKGIKLYVTKERKGRANAHNEVCKTISTDIIAFSDANSMWREDAMMQLISNFKDLKVGFVTGRLEYVNTGLNNTSKSEGAYWKYELMLRKKESYLSSITAGNGAIYAIRRSVYQPINILYSHDFEFPSMVVSKNYNAIYDELAVAEEKAGETSGDEYKRKKRMFSRAWHKIFRNLWIFNPFAVGGLFSVFMISHRLLRYSTGLLQILLFFINLLLLNSNQFFKYIFILQVLFYIGALLGKYLNSIKIFYLLYYFNLFQLATLIGFFKAMTNNVKPFWISPQSTRK